MDVLNEKYNQKELKQQEKNNSITNHQHLIQIIDIISEICKKEEIEELNKFIIGNDDQEGFFKKLYTLLTLENSELNQRYNEVSWELIQSLVESLNQSSIDWDINNHNLINLTSKNILSIIEWISNNSSAREFLLIIQEFDGSSFINQTLFTKISMIIFIQNALKRIPTEKRFNFLKSILPPLLKILIDEKKDENGNQDTMVNNNNEELINNNIDDVEDGDDDDDEEDTDGDDGSNPKEPIKIIGPDIEQELQQKNTDNDIKWQYPLSCIMDFIYSFALDLKAQDTRNDDPNSGITTPRAINSRDPTKESKPNTPIAQQQHLFLNFIIKILSLESVLNPPQSLLCNGMPLLNVVNEIFSLIGASTSYILGTDQRFRLKKREIELEEMYFDQGLNEEDFQDDQDLNLNDPNRKSKKKQLPESSNSIEMDSDDSYIDSDEEDGDKSNNGVEEEEEQDEYNSIDKLFDLDLQYTGIGHLLYLLVLKPTDISRLPSLQSPYSLLMDNLPYLINLLQHKSYKIGFKTIQIISFLQKRLKLSCIEIGAEFLKNPVVEDTIQELMIKATEQHGGNLKSAIERSKNQSETRTRWIHDQSTNSIERPYHFLQLIECMISFLVRCPVQQMRSFSYKVLMLLISNQLKASTKFNLLSTLISTCIFPSFTGLLIHIFKEEINKCWNTSEDATIDHLKSYFRSPKILEIVTIPMQTGGNLLERMDSIMNGLNLYRYLLIRDTNTNYTGVWSKSKIQGSKESCLFPLRKDLLEIQSQFRASSQGDEKAMEKVLQGVSKMGVENLSKDEIKNASTLVCFHIDMALDVITRILELQDTLSLNQNDN